MASRQRRQQLLTGVAGFVVAVVCAHVQDWDSRALIWGLWASSLVVGYAWMISLIVVTQLRAEREKRSGYPRSGALILGGFFTVHFIGFHAGHGFFLNFFFPWDPGQAGATGWARTVGAVLTAQWGLILSTFIARFTDFPRGGLIELEPTEQTGPAKKDKGESPFDDPLFGPYRNVVRMHVMIFVLMGLTALQATVGSARPWWPAYDQLTLYAVLVLYFFPWKVLKKGKQRFGTHRRAARRAAGARPGVA